MATYDPTLTKQELQREKWLPITIYSSGYEVSSLGRIRRVTHCCENCGHKSTTLVKMRPSSKKSRYIRVNLSEKSVEKTFSVSHLVLMAFVGPRPSLIHTANHEDGNKQNNRFGNLSWATPKEQQAHAIKTGLRQRISGIARSSQKITPAMVRRIRSSKKSNQQLAHQHNLSLGHLQRIRNGSAWKHVE